MRHVQVLYEIIAAVVPCESATETGSCDYGVNVRIVLSFRAPSQALFRATDSSAEPVGPSADPRLLAAMYKHQTDFEA